MSHLIRGYIVGSVMKEVGLFDGILLSSRSERKQAQYHRFFFISLFITTVFVYFSTTMIITAM